MEHEFDGVRINLRYGCDGVRINLRYGCDGVRISLKYDEVSLNFKLDGTCTSLSTTTLASTPISLELPSTQILVR